jgi:hypothetical protein
MGGQGIQPTQEQRGGRLEGRPATGAAAQGQAETGLRTVQMRITDACSDVNPLEPEADRERIIANILRVPGVNVEDLAAVLADRMVYEARKTLISFPEAARGAVGEL